MGCLFSIPATWKHHSLTWCTRRFPSWITPILCPFAARAVPPLTILVASVLLAWLMSWVQQKTTRQPLYFRGFWSLLIYPASFPGCAPRWRCFVIRGGVPNRTNHARWILIERTTNSDSVINSLLQLVTKFNFNWPVIIKIYSNVDQLHFSIKPILDKFNAWLLFSEII